MGPGFQLNQQPGLNFGDQPPFQGQPQQAFGGPMNNAPQFSQNFQHQLGPGPLGQNAFQPGWNQAGFVNPMHGQQQIQVSYHFSFTPNPMSLKLFLIVFEIRINPFLA
jgi:hypothetical protein